MLKKLVLALAVLLGAAGLNAQTACGFLSCTATLTASDAGTCATANACLIIAVPGGQPGSVYFNPGMGSASISLAANASGNTIQFEATADQSVTALASKSWVPLSVTPSNSATTATSSASTTGLGWTVNASGWLYLRIRMSTLVGGSTTVSISLSTASAKSGGGGGAAASVPLSGITAAGGTNSITNGNNPQTWQCAQTTAPQSCLTFNESAAATGGTVTNLVPNQSVVNISTAIGSTASALTLSANNNTATNIPMLSMTATVNNASLAATPYVFRTIETNQTAAGSIFEVLGGATGNTPALIIGSANGGTVFNFANSWEQINSGGFMNIKTNNGATYQPVAVGNLTVNDGVGNGVNFGSKVSYSSAGCETNDGPTTLATGAATTVTGQSCLPANSIIDGVVARVTTTITGACTGWELGDATTAARFTTNNTNLTSGSTAVPLSGSAWTTGIASATTGMSQTSASAITITCAGGNPGAGAIRVIVYYHNFTNPSS